MVENILNNYGYKESGTDNPIMPHVLNNENTVGYGKNTTSETEGSWPFDQSNHSYGVTPMGTLDIMSFYQKPAPPAPSDDYLYLEAAEEHSSLFMISTLTTAPNIEYSTDKETWQEWEYTTITEYEGVKHTFDVITLSSIGDRVYLRGNNPNGLAEFDEETYENFSNFILYGAINAGGNVMSLLDKTMELTEIPNYGFFGLFSDYERTGGADYALITPPSMNTVTTIGINGCANMYNGCYSLNSASNMSSLTYIGNRGCFYMYNECKLLMTAAQMPSLTTIGNSGCDCMYQGCTSLRAAADMLSLVSIGGGSCSIMYSDCTFNMTDDGSTLNFAFPTPPITTTGDNPETYATAYEIAEWMGNTNGFQA